MRVEGLCIWIPHVEIVADAAVAVLMCYLAGRTLRWAERKETMERTSPDPKEPGTVYHSPKSLGGFAD